MDGQHEKERGNRLFGEKQYQEAIEAYSEAIEKSPKSAVFYTNRALSYLMLRQWTKVVDDCRKALEIDDSLVKGHFYLGQAQCELKRFDEAVDSLRMAHDLAKEQRKNFGDEIASWMRQAKRKRWCAQEEERLKTQSSLQQLLSQLLLDHRDRQLTQLTCNDSTTADNGQREAVIDQCEQNMSQLRSVFEDADSSRKVRDVPDYLCGKISFELMRDPVITPSGITYDRKDIEEHIHRVGHFDPVTRHKLTEDQLIPNLAMKEVVDSFVSTNSWVDQY